MKVRSRSQCDWQSNDSTLKRVQRYQELHERKGELHWQLRQRLLLLLSEDFLNHQNTFQHRVATERKYDLNKWLAWELMFQTIVCELCIPYLLWCQFGWTAKCQEPPPLSNPYWDRTNRNQQHLLESFQSHDDERGESVEPGLWR